MAAEWSEGVCADGAAVLRDGQLVPISDLVATLNRFESALVEIREGKGRFSLDHFEHARNTIEDMKAVATAALET